MSIFYGKIKSIFKMITIKRNNNINTHSGSRYPGVPATMVDT
jgi:hypothetical protein